MLFLGSLPIPTQLQISEVMAAGEGSIVVICSGGRPMRCDAAVTVDAYEYENITNGMVATMWVSADGLICFQSEWTTSPWHGEFVMEGEYGRVLMTFHYEGDTRKMKTMVAYRSARNQWDGFDGRRRKIKLTFVEKRHYCPGDNSWHTTQAAEGPDIRIHEAVEDVS